MEERNSPLWERYAQYCKEIESIEKRLKNSNLSQGKREKLNFRLKDLMERLIPELLVKIEGS